MKDIPIEWLQSQADEARETAKTGYPALSKHSLKDGSCHGKGRFNRTK